ncbi:MAG: hypothetical protein SGARI_001468 [Bacillariaceae sp.]
MPAPEIAKKRAEIAEWIRKAEAAGRPDLVAELELQYDTLDEQESAAAEITVKQDLPPEAFIHAVSNQFWGECMDAEYYQERVMERNPSANSWSDQKLASKVWKIMYGYNEGYDAEAYISLKPESVEEIMAVTNMGDRIIDCHPRLFTDHYLPQEMAELKAFTPTFCNSIHAEAVVIKLHKCQQWDKILEACGILAIAGYETHGELSDSLAVEVFEGLMALPLLHKNLICSEIVEGVAQVYSDGNTAFDEKRTKEASSCFAKGAKLCGWGPSEIDGMGPRYHDVGILTAYFYTRMTRCCERAKHLGSALDILDQALAINSNLIYAHMHQARILLKSGNPRAAHASITKLLALKDADLPSKEFPQQMFVGTDKWWRGARRVETKILNAIADQEAGQD